MRQQIEEAWEAKVLKNKMQATAELREEFAKKYEHDKSTMVEAIDKMLDEKLGEEIAEFAEDRKSLAEARAKYAVAMRENADSMNHLFLKHLAKRLKSSRRPAKQMS